MGAALCIPGALSVNPASSLSPTTGAQVAPASSSDLRARNAYSRCPQQWARCRVEPRPAFRVAGPHLNCGHIMAGAGSSARASAIPRLSTTAPRAGPAAYVRDPRATVTDHGCSRGPPGFPAWPLHIFMDATGSGGNLVDECYVEVEASTRCQVRASPPTHPARWSRWDRALLISLISPYAERSRHSLTQRS